MYTARRFTCPAAVAATLVLAAGAISAATAAPTLPQPSAYNKLSSVSCLSAANCWAVGSAQDSNNNITGEILHWTGASWSAVSAPAAGGALNSISCSTLSSCWAVGNVGNGQTFPRPLSVRWNGSTWTAVPSPKLAKEVLHAVSCTSSTSCWAVGDYALGRKTFAMHWNGRRWAHGATPNPSTRFENTLQTVTCTSVKDCWALGHYYAAPLKPTVTGYLTAIHWNGSA